MAKILTIEGIPCAGKSTLRSSLEALCLESVGFLPSEQLMADYSKEMPSLAKSYRNARDNESWFLEQEQRKLALARKCTIYDWVVCEREYLSLLGFTYAYSKFTGIDTFAQFEEDIAKSDLILPDKRIVLDISADTFQERDAQREKQLFYPFTNRNFISHLAEFMSSQNKLFMNSEDVTLLDERYNKDIVVKKVKELL